MATFDFDRVTAGVTSDAALSTIMNYGTIKLLPISGKTATDFILASGGSTKWKFSGEDFAYSAKGDPKAGIIESINVTSPTIAKQFQITGVSIDIAAAKAAFVSSTPVDDLIFLAKIFEGNDTFLGSSGKDKFYGHSGNDKMYGNNGNDSLLGGAGRDTIHGDKGVDVLTGGGGADKFVFDTNIKATVPNTNIDTITDFEVTKDIIVLDDAYFAGFALGDLQTAAFVNGDATIAPAPFARIVYDEATGDLFYDGAKAARAPILFAHLDAGLTLTAANFDII